MQYIGSFLVLLGAGSLVLNLMDREFVYFGWVDSLGESMGFAVRVALILIGAGIWWIGNRRAADIE